jgi:protein-disulfide isomerase
MAAMHNRWFGAVVLAILLALAGCGALPASAPPASATPAQVSTVVTPGPPPPNAERNGRAWGPPDAPIQVLKFVDYQCPTCGRYSSEYDQGIVDAFAATGQVRYEARLLAFIGRESFDAAMAALCAADQDAFWPMHRSLFLNQSFDGRENAGVFTRPRLIDMAAQLGLDGNAFGACLDAGRHQAQLDQDRADAVKHGVSRVPAMVVNGRLYPAARSADDLRRIFAEAAPGVKLEP